MPKLRRLLGLLLLAISLAGFAWGIWPFSANRHAAPLAAGFGAAPGAPAEAPTEAGFMLVPQELSTSAAELTTPTGQVFPEIIETVIPTAAPVFPDITQSESRQVVLEWPGTIRLGDTDVIRLSLISDAKGNITPTALIGGHTIEGQAVSIPNLYERYNVLAEAQLDLVGLQMAPMGEISEPLRPGHSVSFAWSVRPTQLGTYRGSIWLHLHFIPIDGLASEIRQPVTAQFIEIKAVNFLGLGGLAARLLGGIGTVLGSALGLDNLLSWIWKLFTKLALNRRQGTS